MNKKHSKINFFSIRDGRNWAKAGALTSILTSWSYSTSNWNCSTTLDSSTNSSMYEANPCHFQVTNMAFLPGLKKQINKANQFMSEKISGVEGTKAGLPVGSWMIDWFFFFFFAFKNANDLTSWKWLYSFLMQTFLNLGTGGVLSLNVFVWAEGPTLEKLKKCYFYGAFRVLFLFFHLKRTCLPVSLDL